MQSRVKESYLGLLSSVYKQLQTGTRKDGLFLDVPLSTWVILVVF
jgi:hypothetical protein